MQLVPPPVATPSEVPSDAAWYESDEPKPMDQVTVAEFEALCKAVLDQREIVEEKKDAAKVEDAKLTKLEMQVLSFLKGTNRSNYKSKVGTMTLSKKRSWALPKSDEDRKAFFEFLKTEGTFDGMITVNSNTFNSYLKEKYETAEASGESSTFQVPGVGEASVFESLRFTKGK
jgi:hypothetical protein